MDLHRINKQIDEETIPVIEKVDGVRSVRAYNSINGELVSILDIENMATIDRILEDPGCAATLGKTLDDWSRSGGEVLFDRPSWQALYGKKSTIHP